MCFSAELTICRQGCLLSCTGSLFFFIWCRSQKSEWPNKQKVVDVWLQQIYWRKYCITWTTYFSDRNHCISKTIKTDAGNGVIAYYMCEVTLRLNGKHLREMLKQCSVWILQHTDIWKIKRDQLLSHRTNAPKSMLWLL